MYFVIILIQFRMKLLLWGEGGRHAFGARIWYKTRMQWCTVGQRRVWGGGLGHPSDLYMKVGIQHKKYYWKTTMSGEVNGIQSKSWLRKYTSLCIPLLERLSLFIRDRGCPWESEKEWVCLSETGSLWKNRKDWVCLLGAEVVLGRKLWIG